MTDSLTYNLIRTGALQILNKDKGTPAQRKFSCCVLYIELKVDRRSFFYLLPTTTAMMSNVARNKRSRAVFRQTGRRVAPRLGASVPATRRLSVGALELKNLDVATPGGMPAVGATTGTVLLLNGVAQGTTAITRLGRMIKIRKIQFRLRQELQATSTLSENFRCLIVYDKQTNAAALTSAQVLESDLVISPINLGNQRRFRILYDRTIRCIGTGGPQSIEFVFSKTYKTPITTEFNAGSAGTVADITTGSIYGIFISSGNVGVAAPVSYLWSRILFSDN